MTAPLLSIRNLSISFGSHNVVRDVSLALEKGEILAIVGESGSGKTLTAQSILKLLPANAEISGEIRFQGAAGNLLTAPPREIAKIRGGRIGMIFQEPMTSLNPLHTIGRQIIESYCIHHRLSPRSAQAKQKLAELYAAVGLTHLAQRGALYPHQLSGGERQRVMIAIAIANDPDLLIADEPTTALDVTLQQQILALLKQLQATRGMGMIFITHDLLTVRRFADRMIVMHRGAIVEQNTTAALFAGPEQPYTKMLLAAAPHGVAAPLAAAAPEILHVQNLCVSFPVKSPVLRRTLRQVQAVENVSLTLRAGETIGIVGKSGSGKSSLGYALLRLIPSTGPIVFLSQRMDALSMREVRPYRARMQLVFQDPYGSLNPRMTVGDIIAEGLKLHGRARKVDSPLPLDGKGGMATVPDRISDPNSSTPHTPSPFSSPLQSEEQEDALTPQTLSRSVDEIMAQVGLTPEMKSRYPHEFSGGQRQRIAIARAMILKPRLVVLDEPTSALDMSVQAQVLELLKHLQATHQVSYLFISHDLRVIRAVAHQVLVLKNGVVVEQGTAEQLFSHPQHPYTQTLLAAALRK